VVGAFLYVALTARSRRAAFSRPLDEERATAAAAVTVTVMSVE